MLTRDTILRRIATFRFRLVNSPSSYRRRVSRQRYSVNIIHGGKKGENKLGDTVSPPWSVIPLACHSQALMESSAVFLFNLNRRLNDPACNRDSLSYPPSALFSVKIVRSQGNKFRVKRSFLEDPRRSALLRMKGYESAMNTFLPRERAIVSRTN